MVHATVCVRAWRTLRFFVAAFLLTLATAHAGPVAFGNRTIYVPEPDGFIPLANRLPRFIQLAQAYLPQNIRLVEAYVSPADAAAMEQGNSAAMQRYFQMQTVRATDGVPVSNEEFAAAATEIESGIRKAIGDADSSIKSQADKGNAEIKRQTAVDPQMQLTGTGYLGMFRQEPWGQFFTIKTNASAKGLMMKPQQVVGAGAIVLVNYQIVFLYSYANYNNEGDRQWAEHAVSAWADQVPTATIRTTRKSARRSTTASASRKWRAGARSAGCWDCWRGFLGRFSGGSEPASIEYRRGAQRHNHSPSPPSQRDGGEGTG